MTKRELVQLYYLNREIINDTEELVKLKIRQKEGQGRSKITEEYIAECEKEIVEKIRKCTKLRDRVKTFINSIDDSLTRQVFYYRYSKCMRWQQVACIIGGSNTADSVRKIAERYLKCVEKE